MDVFLGLSVHILTWQNGPKRDRKISPQHVQMISKQKREATQTLVYVGGYNMLGMSLLLNSLSNMVDFLNIGRSLVGPITRQG